MTIFFLNTIPDSFYFFLMSFAAAFTTYFCIFLSKDNFLSFLHIPASKSPTNAKLLGGLGISAGFLATYAMISAFKYDSFLINSTDFRHLIVSTFAISMLTISGYIDDRFELRARYKLLFQFMAISLFAFISTKEIAHNQPVFIFFVSLGLGILLINGTNLLDGLDTLTIKLGIVTSLAFMYLGIKSESTLIIFISSSTIATLAAFYFFNKEPARIYLGEIGGSVLGFIYYLQATMAYEKLNNFGNGYSSMSWVFIACSLPICELGISFIRRVLMKKSPFRGDKLHLHHILRAKYALTASNTSSIMALIYGITFVLGYLLAKVFGPEIGAVISISFIISFYIIICLDQWIATKNSFQLENLFLFFEGKIVHVVDSNALQGVHFELDAENSKKKIARAA